MDYMVWMVFAAALLAIIYAVILISVNNKKPSGSKKMVDIAKLIQDGAKTYLKRQYLSIAVIALTLFVILLYAIGIRTALGFLIGALFSALAGFVGMNVATSANVKTTEAAKQGLKPALKIAFRSGTIMGLLVTGLGLMAAAGYYAIFKDLDALIGLGFGGSFVALFARVGGGIFTKAADVGADIVGKVENDIPEDDPRNPAVIADNVGDNVGDVAGMGADLYESYVDSLIVAMILGVGLFTADKGIYLPLVLAGAGIVAAILGTFAVRVGKRGVHAALNRGIYISAIFMAVFAYLVSKYYVNDINIFYTMITGILTGLLIGKVTGYYTSKKSRPVQQVAKASESGPATNIISGLSLGMTSTIAPVIIISAAILLSFYLMGLFGIALAAVGMLATLAITLATDTYGPVADNAAGIAKMANLPSEVRNRMEELDAVGNTTAAIGKGFAIGSAVLTSIALFAGYSLAVNLTSINIISPPVMVGLMLGAMLPFIFSALTLKAVSDAADVIVAEVRHQFKNIKGLLQGKAEADYNKCISIATDAALKEMIAPALIAIIAPLVIGIVLGPESLGGLLAGTIASGFLLAIMMANSGGAWDNAKKYIEAGNLGGQGSDVHKASVVGDTVGDPFKDTSGPSINILIKLVSIVSLLIAPLILIDFSFTVKVVVASVSVVVMFMILLLNYRIKRSYHV